MSTRKVTTEDLKGDFKLFLTYLWRFLKLSDPTPLQLEIADYLQSGPKRFIIEAFRGIGKSWISSAYVLWCLWRNPEEKFLIISATQERAKNFTGFCQRLITEVPFLRHLMPQQEYHRWSKLSFDVGPSKAAQSPSVKALGITGQLQGTRATKVLFDDVEVMNNSMTPDARDRLIQAILDIEAVVIPEGDPRIGFLGTPQTEESIYNKLGERGYLKRIWPARIPPQDKVASYDGCLSPSIEALSDDSKVDPGTPTDTRFSNHELLEREAAMGRSGFLLQFMLDTTLSDAERYPLKVSDLVCFQGSLRERAPSRISWAGSKEHQIKDLLNVGFSGDRWYSPMFFTKEDFGPYEGVIMSIDPSGRGKDETAYAVLGMLHGNLYLLDSGGFKGGYEDSTLNGLGRIAKTFVVNKVVVEDNFGDGMFTRILTPVLVRHHPCVIDSVKHHRQKELRIIDVLEPVLNSHRLVIPVSVIRKDLMLFGDLESQYYSLFYQLTRITRERGALRQDDRLDALAIAVAYWTDMMSRDEDRAHKDFLTARLERELEDHMKYSVSLGGSLGREEGLYQTSNTQGSNFLNNL